MNGMFSRLGSLSKRPAVASSMPCPVGWCVRKTSHYSSRPGTIAVCAPRLCKEETAFAPSTQSELYRHSNDDLSRVKYLPKNGMIKWN